MGKTIRKASSGAILEVAAYLERRPQVGREPDHIWVRLNIALNNLAMPRIGRVMRHDIEE